MFDTNIICFNKINIYNNNLNKILHTTVCIGIVMKITLAAKNYSKNQIHVCRRLYIIWENER